jgi:hypothetical protein
LFDYIILKPAQKYLERLRVEEQVRIIRAAVRPYFSHNQAKAAPVVSAKILMRR